jgi:hypothetical protein
MNNVVDFTVAKEKKKEQDQEGIVILDADEALQYAISIAADIGILLDEMGIPLENDVKSMGDIYLMIDVLKALITRVAGIECDAQILSEKLIDIDHAEHLISFREIMESD